MPQPTLSTVRLALPYVSCETDGDNWLAMNVSPEKCDGKPINIACAEAVSLNVILKTLKQLLHSDIEPIYEPERIGDVKHSLADISSKQWKLS